MRSRLRALIMGLSTLTGFRRQGFFIPHRLAHRLPPPGANPPYGVLGKLFDDALPDMRRVLAMIQDVAPELAALGKDPPPAPRWSQIWFPRLDGAAAYALVRHHRPGRIVEVGAGHSTRFLARAVADGRMETTITAIDPAPRATIDGLAVERIALPLHEAAEEATAGLAAGDFLVIDSSHILMPGSDVDFILNRILPALPAGVLVHFHDIFLPDDYPARWGWRAYNEQQGVAALLQGGAYRIVFSSQVAKRALAEEIAASLPAGIELPDGALESSLWLIKTAKPIHL